MDPFFGATMMMSSMMTTVMPMALLVGGAHLDEERLARGVAQMAVMGMRMAVDVTYDDLVYDKRSGDFSVRGLEINIPSSVGVENCSVTIDAITVVSLSRPDAFSNTAEGDGISVAPECAADQGPMILSMFGSNALDFDHYSASSVYDIGDSSLDYSLSLETAAAGSVTVAAELDRLHFNLGRYGDPEPAGTIKSLEVTLQNIDTLRELVPMLGIGNDPVAVAKQGLTEVLSKDGLNDAEKAFIDSATTELTRVMKDGGSITLRSGKGIAVNFKQLEQTRGPEDLVALFQPTFAASALDATEMVSGEMLTKALKSPGDLSDEEALRVATALTSGVGAPKSPRAAASLLSPLAEKGNAGAALQLAEMALEQGNALDAYALALDAGKGEASGARSTLDRIEGAMTLEQILDLQVKARSSDAPNMGGGDLAEVRTMARRYANGTGVARDYNSAVLLAMLAGAAGDRGSQMLVERLSQRFDDDESRETWRKVEEFNSDAALSLWGSGFGAKLSGK